MLDRYKILTVTHRHTPLKQIAHFVVKAEGSTNLQAQLTTLKAAFAIEELYYLATCNRVMYLISDDVPMDVARARAFVSAVNPDLQQSDLLEELKVLTGAEAVRHFFEVGASMDSLVIGERQILGQLREAYEQCVAWDLCGDDIRLLFQQAVVAAKDIYANTRIGEKPVSVVSLAIQKVMQLGLQPDARILIVGAGQTNALVAKFLKKYHFNKVTVFNRTLQRASQLAAAFDEGRALPFEELANYREGFDCLIVCTAAVEPIITRELFRKLLAGEDAADKIIVDLSVPHNVAADVVDNYTSAYVEIEDLRSLAQENVAFREREVKRAAHLLKLHLEEFPLIWRQRQLERALSRVPAEIKAVRQKAVNEVFRKELEGLDAQTRELMDRMLVYMEKKCISIPMRAAKESLIS